MEENDNMTTWFNWSPNSARSRCVSWCPGPKQKEKC